MLEKKLCEKEYIDKKWFSIIKEINPKDVASKRSEMLTQKYLKLAWKDENIDENTKRERDKENTEYCDDGWGKYSSMSQYYYANSLDHYLTHLSVNQVDLKEKKVLEI